MSNKIFSEQEGGRTALVPSVRFPEFKDAGDWERKTLDDVADFFKGKGISKSEIHPQGETPCIRYGELYTIYGEVIKTVVSKTKLAVSELFFGEKNDVLIPSSGETKIDIARASCVLADGIALGGDLNVLRSDENGVFLSYMLNSVLKREIAKKAQGDSVVHLYASQLKLVDIAVPIKQEQQKIADCLTSMDDLISAEAKKLLALKTHKKGLMQSLFPAEGEAVPKLRFPEFRDAGEWNEKKLSDFATIVRGGSPRPIDEYITNDADGLNWLKIGDIDKESKFVTSTKEKVISAALSKTREVNPGDLILSNSMSFGRPYILKIKTCIHDGWIAISQIKDDVSRDYLYYLMMTTACQDYFSNNAAGSGVQNLNADIIKLLPIAYPTKEEQQKVADCLSSVDEKISTVVKNLDMIKLQKEGLMQQLFPALDEVFQ